MLSTIRDCSDDAESVGSASAVSIANSFVAKRRWSLLSTYIDIPCDVKMKCCAVFCKQERRVYGELVINILIGLVAVILTVVNLNNSEEFLKDRYCQLNSLVKSEPDVVHENHTNLCNSEIVLDFTVDELRYPLLVPMVMQAIVTLALIPTSALAIYGTRKTKAKHMYPWLITKLLWVICLIVRMIILYYFALTNYALFLLLPFGIAVTSFVDVGLFTLNILRTTGSYEVKPVPMQDFSDGHASALVSPSAG